MDALTAIIICLFLFLLIIVATVVYLKMALSMDALVKGKKKT
jgi:hypothetical protein